MVGRRRFGWELTARDHATGRRVAVARPKLRPGAYSVDDGSARRLRLRRRLRAGRWRLLSERGPVAHITFTEYMSPASASLRQRRDQQIAAELTLVSGSTNLADTGPIVLLAIATIRAEMSIPVLDTPAY